MTDYTITLTDAEDGDNNDCNLYYRLTGGFKCQNLIHLRIAYCC